MKSIRQAILFFFAVVLFSSCATSRKSNSSLSETSRLDFAYSYFEANKEKMLGNTDKALTLYLQCLRIDGKSHAAMYEAALLMAEKNNTDNAIYFLRSAATLDPDNIWYQVTLAELYKDKKLYPEASAVYEKLTRKYPDHVDLYYDYANTLLLSNKFLEAIKAYDHIEQQIGMSTELSVQKEKIYVHLGKFDKAVAEIQKSIDADPKAPENYSLLADLYQSNAMNDKAMEALKKLRELDPENPFMHLSYAEFYRKNNDSIQAFDELKLAFSSKRLEIETAVEILAGFYKEMVDHADKKQQAMELNQIMVATNPDEARAFSVYGDFLNLDKQFEHARIQYRKSVELDKQTYAVWIQLLSLDADLKDYKALEQESEEAMVLFPAQPVTYYYNGLAKLQQDKDSAAIESLTSGVKLVVDNKDFEAQFYASIGDAQHKLKAYRKSDEAFNKALELNPVNSYVLNNYSYYLSLRGDSLEKAEKLSLQANQLEPDNVNFQDTYGWILYVQKKYDEAKRWIEKSLANGGDTHGVILEHYGDVLWHLKMPDRALEYWEKAKIVGDASKLLDRKLSEKKLIE